MMHAAVVGGKAEAVAADHRPVVEDHPVADGAAFSDGDVGVEDGVVADGGVAADHHSGMDGHPLAEHHPVAQADQRTDAHLGRNDTVAADHRARVHAAGRERPGEQAGVDAGGGHRGLVGDKGRHGQRRAAGGHDAGAGPAAVRQGQLAGVEEKGDFTGAGLFDAVEAADDELRVADHAASHQVGELLQSLFVGHG